MADPATPTIRRIAAAPDWHAADIVCHAGPETRIYEEQHGWTTIAFVRRGTFTYRGAQGRALLVPGGLLLGNAGQCFACGHEHGRGDQCLSVQLAPSLMEQAAASAGIKGSAFTNAAIPPLQDLLPLFAALRALGNAAAEQADAMIFTLAIAALSQDRGAASPRVSIRDEARVAQAVRMIQQHYTQPLTVTRLAAELGMQRRHFARVFRQVNGVTPYSYILGRRLDAAADALCRGGAPVLDIALQAGFGDLSEFTRRFRARYGMPPGRYRLSPGQDRVKPAAP